MATSRIEVLKQLLAQDPADATAYYMLAVEYHKAQMDAEAIDAIQRYLAMAADEGAAYRVLAQSLARQGRRAEARQAYHDGLAAARQHGHDPMIAEYEQALDELTEADSEAAAADGTDRS